RVQRPVPGDDLAGVARHAAHDGHERAPGHPLAVVDRLAGADAGEQLVVLRLVHVVVEAGRLPVAPRPGAPDRVPHHVAGAPGAPHVVVDVVVAVVLLAAEAEQLDAALVLEDHGVVVEDVAALRLGAHLAAAHAAGPDGVLVLHGPGHLVQAVDVLLDDVVA